jgi:methyltransferase (TIGR00027 family)
MQTGRASRTALRVAHRRAAHQLLDQPCILHDPIAVPLLGPEFSVDYVRESHPIAKAFRAFMAARSRFAEDELLGAAEKSVSQYVVLGAGLDTFAYRNTNHHLRVFEVDFPATQEWKRSLLGKAGIALPSNLTFVPLDFENHTIEEGLAEAGLNMNAPAFFGWLGVVPYLSLQAFRSSIKTIVSMPRPTAVTFDFAVDPELLDPRGRAAFDALSARVAAVGEPFQLFFRPEELGTELREAGFSQVEFTFADDLNARYFADRKDSLKLPVPGLGIIATARV